MALAPNGNDPFAGLGEVPSFELTSTTVEDGGMWPAEQYSGAFGIEGGKDISPQLSWSGAPEGTKSFAVTVFDPDAPTQSGFWHWVLTRIPASVTELPEGAGDGLDLPEGAFQLKNDGGQPGFIGAAPPQGHGPHRYVITVHALDVEDLGVDGDTSPAKHGFMMFGHTLGRATIVVNGEIPA